MTPLISLIGSTIILALCIFLFRYEQSRGARFLSNVRAHIDFHLLKIRHSWNIGVRYWGRYFVRQVIHYIFHTFLTGLIKGLRVLEERLKLVVRSNRALARKSETERTSMNILEEVALHKLEVALSEEEKKRKKQESLEG